MVGLNKTAKERKIKLKKGIIKGKSIKIGFRKLIIDEQIWIWSKESRKLGHLSIKENSPTQNITKKKLIIKESKEINEKTWQRTRGYMKEIIGLQKQRKTRRVKKK
jgi:hypothetical protein